MNMLSMVIATIAPGISLLLYFYLKDRYELEPIRLVSKMFLFGALIVYPVMSIQQAFIQEFGNGYVLLSFFISGGIEEFFKWFLMYHLIYRHAEFDEPYDGIVYAVAISLGFATLENVIYGFLLDPTFFELMLRALLPVSGHALFGVMMGYYMGRAKFEPKQAYRLMWISLIIPILWHGLYDWLLLSTRSNWVWFMIPLMTFLWIRALLKIKRSQVKSLPQVLYRDPKM